MRWREAAAQRRGALLECACTPRLHACTRSSAGTRTARPSMHVATAPYALQHNCTPPRRQATKSDPSVLSKGCIYSMIMCDVTRVTLQPHPPFCTPPFFKFFVGCCTVFQWCWCLCATVIIIIRPEQGPLNKPLSAWWALPGMGSKFECDKTSIIDFRQHLSNYGQFSSCGMPP